MRCRTAILAALALLWAAAAAAAPPEEAFTEEFPLADCRLTDRGRNPYLSLEPGDRLVLEGEDDGEEVTLQITVLKDTTWIVLEDGSGGTLSIRARIVEEREWVDGELVEVSRNFMARCERTDDVYYFGEEVDFYEDGVVVGHEGAWRAGEGGARPGLLAPGTFLLGSRYFQELAPGVALDRAEHVAMGLTVEVPAGEFQDCVEVLETSALSPGDSRKVYCPGIGLVDDDGLELVEVERADDRRRGRK